MTGIVAARYIVKNPYAWPGGYPLALVMDDGGLICPSCAEQEWESILWSWVDNIQDGWQPVDIIVINDDHTCVHCGKRFMEED